MSATFGRLTVPQVGPTAAISQSLDNQWLDEDLLAEAARAGEVTQKIEQRRQTKVREEYLRALLTSGQLVVNRAYLFNNPAISADYANKGPERDAFRALLREKAIVPYLLFEETPDQEQSAMTVASTWESWRDICREGALSCLRLSWDPDENQRLISDHVFRPFARGIQDLNLLEPDGLARDFRLPAEDAVALRDRFTEVATWAFRENSARRAVTRELLYNNFVTAGGSRPVDRRYDADPLTRCVKQMIDLKYNTNLGDALDLFTITPAGSPRRSALQEEVRLRQGGRAAATDADELKRLMRNLVFQAVAQLGEGLPTLQRLTLDDVKNVRDDVDGLGAWNEYMTLVSRLLADPSAEALLDPGGGLPAVVASYQRLMAQAETVAGRRSGDRQIQRAQGFVEIAIDIGVSAICVYALPTGESFFEVSPDWNQAVAGAFAGLAVKRAAGVVIRLGIGRHRDMMTRRRIDHTMRVLRLRLDDPGEQAAALMRHLQETGAILLPPSRPGTDWSQGEEE